MLLLGGALLAGCDGSAPPADPEAVVPRLVALLKDRDPDVRRTAAQSLGKMGASESADALVDSLRDVDPMVRQYSAWALGNLGAPALEKAGLPLVTALTDPSEAVRTSASAALGRVLGSGGPPQALVELLIDRLNEPDAETRRAAVGALAWIEAGSAYLALVEALRDEDARVRQGAVAALGELADRRAIPSLGERVLHDPDAGVRTEAAFRLGKFGDETVIQALQSAATEDPDPGVRRWAAWAIQQVKTPSTGEPVSRS